MHAYVDNMFGIRCFTHCLALNHLIMLDKYFILCFCIKFYKVPVSRLQSVALLQEKMKPEKYIVAMSNEEKGFINK